MIKVLEHVEHEHYISIQFQNFLTEKELQWIYFELVFKLHYKLFTSPGAFFLMA